MDRRYRLISSVILSAALAAPVGLMAVAGQQENMEHDEHDRSYNQKSYYDRVRGDYHTWDRNEDRAYERYREEHRLNRAFAELNEQEQKEYWNWRHAHPNDGGER